MSSFGSHVSGEARIFDAIYDPLFTVSGPKDAWRANTYALSKSMAPNHVLSQYNVMFSDLPKESRSVCLRQDEFLPHFRLRAGSNECSKDDQSENSTEKKLTCGDISGKYRTCFFQHTVGNTVVINLNLELSNVCDQENEKISSEENVKNVGCQTMYRESSAQTWPYQPEVFLAPDQDEEPEILRISKLITGDNQPGEFEAKIIDRARRRREWEKTLPKLSTKKEMQMRKIILEAFEWEEWISREEEIENVQNMRLELVTRLLQKRNQCFELKSKAKIEITTQKIEEKRTVELQKLQKTYDRKLRKLEAKHMKISKKYVKANIVEEHTDFTSELYAPQMRFGVNPSRRHYSGFRKEFNERVDNLDKKIREKASTECSLVKRGRLSKQKARLKEIVPGFKRELNLKKVYDELTNLRMKKIIKDTPKCLIFNPSRDDKLSDAIVGVDCDERAEAEYRATVYLQKIIKGRSVQNILYKSRENFRGLIDEIKTTKFISSVSDICPLKMENLRRKTLAFYKYQQHIRQITKTKIDLNNILTKMEAPIIGTVLDFLKNELKRLYEQRKVHAIYMLAEKERKKREAFEQTKRQREDIRRIEHKEIYRNLTKASRDVVTFYLENVLIDETNLKAENDARKKVEKLAKYIDKTANKCHSITQNDYDDCEENDVIFDLVEDFVYPEINKRLARKRMELRQRKYLLAAHRELYQNIEANFAPDVVDNGNEMADQILQDLIDKAIDSDYALTELTSTEDVAHHEALAAIKKVINRVLPKETKWKSSAERIVSATVSELTKLAVYGTKEIDENEGKKNVEANKTTTQTTTKDRTKEMLQDIVLDMTHNLWKTIFDYSDDESKTPASKSYSKNPSICKSKSSDI